MSARVAVIIGTGERDKAEAGLMYAVNAARDGTDEALSGLGLEVAYVGELISNLIKGTYTPLVW